MAWKLYPSGKIKDYWVKKDRDPKWIINDPVDGVDGSRKWLLDVIPDNESILDIGCGPGHVSAVFTKAGRKNTYLGVDNNPDTVKFAQSLFPNIKFEQGDCFFLPYEDDSFDNCILFTVVEMVADFRKPIEEALRLAKKRVIVTTFIPLVDGSSKNTHIINCLGDYVVNISKGKFLDFINAFGFKVNSGVLEYDGKIQYWYWVIEK